MESLKNSVRVTKIPLDKNSKGAKLQNLSKPYAYQQEAINQTLKTFKSHDRTHIVMACGTGKTRVALWIAERLKAKNIVVFVPSLALIAQLMQEWLTATSWKKVSCLALCSDDGITRGTDCVVVNPEDCDFPVTTDPKIVTEFLQRPILSVRVVFCTYHSSGILSKAVRECQPFDLGVFDEAHKTAGNNHFSLALNNNEVAIQKRLFMTATPKHYDIRHKNEAEGKLRYSMDSETLYGPRAYTLSFRRAIELGVISDYKVMISVVHSAGDSEKDPSPEKKIVALRKAILKDPNISKVITFHRTIEEAVQFSAQVKDSKTLPSFESLHISGLTPGGDRRTIMQKFKEMKKVTISNARCLTEGIDVPAVDMVGFLNQKKSKIDIIQAIGRAMRKSKGKTHGYVFLPLFVANNAGETLEDAVLRADYGDIWDVVQALSEQDDNLQATIQALKIGQGKGKNWDLG